MAVAFKGNVQDEFTQARSATNAEIDFGLFGPQSASWQLHGDPSGFVGGIRALLIQALSMRSMRAVSDFSDYRSDPWGRLFRTSDFIMTTTYRSRPDALAAIAKVRRVHDAISGFDPGSELEYSANSPELLAFIHNCFVDSMLVSYQALVRPLSRQIQLSYLVEQAEIARLLGADMSAVVFDPSQLASAISHFRDIGLSDGAKMAFEDISHPKFDTLEFILAPLWGLVFETALDLLPPFARDIYGIGRRRLGGKAREATLASLAQVARLVLPSHPYLRIAKYQYYAEHPSTPF